MREVEFRGKSLNTGLWVFGLLMTVNKALGTAVITEHGCGHLRKRWVIDLSTVGQYTGLKDALGNEIYEGDIVKGVSHKFDSWSSKLIPFDVIGVVEYHKEYQTLEVSTGQQSLHIEVAIKGEVIGNIHDNPELKGGVE